MPKARRLVLVFSLAGALAGGSALAASGAPLRQTQPPPTTTPPPNPCTDPGLHLRCPDLVMSAPYDLVLDRKTRRGHVLLRASSSINNHGSGPLRVVGRRRDSRSMTVSQQIQRPGGTFATFPTQALLGFKFITGRRYGFTFPDARYWKFRDAARFQLWSLDSEDKAVSVARFGPKLFYCFRDLQRTRPSGRSPHKAVFPACSENPRQRRVTLGTSVGWSDIYPYTYPEQYIDVTGLRGRFAYVQVADPFNRLFESNELNNVSETFISLPSGRILGRRHGVAFP
jgi:hypothetical protein